MIDQIAEGGRIAGLRELVGRAWRKSAIPAVLMGAAYKLLRRQGVRFDF